MLIEPLYREMACGLEKGIFSNFFPKFVQSRASRSIRIADCGACVGQTAILYDNTIRTILNDEAYSNSEILCYEPLYENIVQLTKNVRERPIIHIVESAVSDFVGKESFVVPYRFDAMSASMPAGTSWAGLLKPKDFGSHQYEMVDVDVLRLDSQGEFDFIKLDLQGGEIPAIVGLGGSIQNVSIIYSETSLLPKTGAVDFLRQNGFVCFYDTLLIGMNNSAKIIDFRKLESIGINITSGILPEMCMKETFLCNGYFDIMNAHLLDDDGELYPEIAEELTSLGVRFIQSDIIAVNARIAGDALNLI
ncbi:MAG: FkbM family methyltransferase [Methylocystis sp.]